MCGEHANTRASPKTSTGSSPHVRGAPVGIVHWKTPPGIIPACAGSTTGGDTDSLKIRDHPRMCGEHWITRSSVRIAAGSSPHVRGARYRYYITLLVLGIIPACAGSTWMFSGSRRWPRDHPRMCGEHRAISYSAIRDSGSSPHVRGARVLSHPRVTGCGIIPACAGST